jgi:KDO2-lipid IV(A) lauroyltransferase
LIGLLPFRLLFLLSDVFFVIVGIVGYRRKVITQNLTNAFPEKNQLEIRKIRFLFYRHFCDLFVETLALQHFAPRRILKRIETVNAEALQQSFDNGKDVIAVLGHYGNWEWVPASMLQFKNVLGTSVYRPLKNKWFDKFMLNIRSCFNTRNIPLYSTTREIVKLKRKNQRFALGLIADQSPSKSELHYWTDFLNQNTSVILGPEKMAKLTNADLFYFKTEKTGRGRYRITFIPFPEDVQTATEYKTTEWHLRLLEQQILQKPQYWLWSHKRWKYQYLYQPGIHTKHSS